VLKTARFLQDHRSARLALLPARWRATTPHAAHATRHGREPARVRRRPHADL